MERDDSERQYIVNMLHFNSHAHVERDWNTQTAGVKLEISTHTLTWSVTPKSACPYQQRFHFNSHAHVERDKNTYITLHWYKNFNSHAHVERDDAECVRRGLIKISTHTLTWSVTFPILFCKVRILISTHTLTWSVTDKRTKQTRYQFISTHTLTWSVTIASLFGGVSAAFQLTRSRGA